MKNSKLMIGVVGIALALLAAHSTFAQDKTQHYNLDDTKIALDGYSPVSYFEKGQAEKGSKQYKSQYEGVSYYFTSNTQKTTFENDPSKCVVPWRPASPLCGSLSCRCLWRLRRHPDFVGATLRVGVGKGQLDL